MKSLTAVKTAHRVHTDEATKQNKTKQNKQEKKRIVYKQTI